ncbi:TBC1 domain family member 12-like isoform X2 [Pseudoliparis swirei]|uniref:TBC1 domain family member 12-like isoform X2 n=1 Tax=Pseudoliparis swirei TaxID=2059687 RepID=UPI0024BE5417|nr:TBC1 domain family member 12-like isoform X2 [Pseudoliparis swirei]XP_056285057.1 TBC1 domain family member 12-like isoform X2 [Pseudoliparis swirei]XP_056285058.1 TBC1 domain family member 12-like isoform X2 [Pseudoliparis swirei]XP_056285059.1 TBC1 domain family member 12-like isoform X2 [Pseudoliparis swirei]
MAACSSPTHHAAGRPSRAAFGPPSTTALILEDRPPSLPAKSSQEAQRHRQQHEQMVSAAKRRELKEAQRRRQQKEQRLRQEEVLSNTSLVWSLHILPHWALMRSSPRAQDLWWGGLPPRVRGRVWSLALGNELNITSCMRSSCPERRRSGASVKPTAGSSSPGTCPGRCPRCSSSTRAALITTCCKAFWELTPATDLMWDMLCLPDPFWRPLLSTDILVPPSDESVSHVQGMSSMAAMLILNQEEVEVFISFSNLVNRPCQLAFYRGDRQLVLRYFGAFQVFFQETLPRLFLHFQYSGVTPDLYLLDWIRSLYLKPLPLDVACRIWDLFFRDGEEFLLRAALGILRLYQDLLLQLDLVCIAHFLSRLPDEELLSDRLFACISATPMLSGTRKWTQVLSSCRDSERSS